MLKSSKLRFMIADDHPMIRDALRITIDKLFPESVVFDAGQLSDVTDLLKENEAIDLILLDLAMPGMHGFSGLLYLRAQYPHISVAILSANDDHDAIRKAVQLGAAGYIPKSMGPNKVLEALKNIVEGNVWIPEEVNLNEVDSSAGLAMRLSKLTPQQVRVLMMLSEGLLNKQIAYELNVSEATVKAHVSAILSKLGVENRTQAVIASTKMEVGQLQVNENSLRSKRI